MTARQELVLQNQLFENLMNAKHMILSESLSSEIARAEDSINSLSASIETLNREVIVLTTRMAQLIPF